jgi:hypothetical protein
MSGLSKALIVRHGRHLPGEGYRNPPEDHRERGCGVVGHAGTRLLADVADATGLTGEFGNALAGLRQRQSGHDPGRVAAEQPEPEYADQVVAYCGPRRSRCARGDRYRTSSETSFSLRSRGSTINESTPPESALGPTLAMSTTTTPAPVLSSTLSKPYSITVLTGTDVTRGPSGAPRLRAFPKGIMSTLPRPEGECTEMYGWLKGHGAIYFGWALALISIAAIASTVIVHTHRLHVEPLATPPPSEIPYCAAGDVADRSPPPPTPWYRSPRPLLASPDGELLLGVVGAHHCLHVLPPALERSQHRPTAVGVFSRIDHGSAQNLSGVGQDTTETGNQ